MKRISLFVFAVFATLSSFAQSPVGSVTFIPRVGVTIANVTNSQSDPRIGVILGADAQYQASKVIALSGGLYYSQQGCKDSDGGVTATLANNYLNIPLLVNAYVAPGLALKAGIQPAVLLTADVKASDGSNSGSMDIKDAYETFDFSIPLGISYEFSKFVADFRYNLGLTKLLKDVGTQDNGKNSVFQFTLGYRF